MRLKVGSIALVVFLSVLSVFMCVDHVQSLTYFEQRPIPPVIDTPTVPETPVHVPPPIDPGEVPEPDVDLPGLRRLQLALARICVSEAGFQVRSNDCTLIYHVLRGRSRTGELTMGIMRAYAGMAFNERRTDSRRWILHLNHTFDEPREWSETVTIPWSVRRAGYIDVYHHAGMLVRTRPRSTPCGVRVSHWGARGFRRDLHLRQGWRLVRCGNTHNDFWYVPSRRDADEPEVTHDQEVASL
jgi:hypothetical protein